MIANVVQRCVLMTTSSWLTTPPVSRPAPKIQRLLHNNTMPFHETKKSDPVTQEVPMSGDIDSVNHLGISVRNLDQACALYEALGFTLSPLSVHAGSPAPGEPIQPMATGNRCAIFPHNYVEILGIVNPDVIDSDWDSLVERFYGANIVCFGCKDAGTVDARLVAAGVPTSGVVALQRDIETEAGMKTAAFDCVLVDLGETPEGLLQAARHHNPEYVHQTRYLGHSNGTTAMSEILLVTTEPEAMARRYQTLTGQPMHGGDDTFSIQLPLVTRLRFADPEAVARELRGSLLPPAPAVAAVTYAVADLDRARDLVVSAGFPVIAGTQRFHVPAENALGVVHIFEQR